MKVFKTTILAVALTLMVATSGGMALAATTTPTTTVGNADTSVLAALIQRLQDLIAQYRSLQEQISGVRSDIQDELKDGLEQGMSDEDIRKIQEILATDRSVYPEGLVTGYFGPLTSAALTRFQNKFKLEVTGTLSEETKQYLQELWQERTGSDDVPPGLLVAPGIREKIELRLEEGCDNSGEGKDIFCQKLRVRIENKNDDDDEVDDDNSGTDDNDNDDDSDDDDSDDDNSGSNDDENDD